MQRLSFLDSYRAIAITAVAGFHFFARWSPPIADASLYPYGSRFADWALFQLGSFGINLFFLISGFVITFTLQRCETLFDFTVKRIARLWPALIVCTAAVLALRLSPLAAPGPSVHIADLLPSLTTVEPKLFQGAGIRADYIIGAVWTLFIELRFYALAAAAYFLFSRRHVVLLILVYAVVGMVAALLRGNLDGGIGMLLTSVVLVRSIGWFALGAFTYKLHAGTQTRAEICWRS